MAEKWMTRYTVQIVHNPRLEFCKLARGSAIDWFENVMACADDSSIMSLSANDSHELIATRYQASRFFPLSIPIKNPRTRHIVLQQDSAVCSFEKPANKRKGGSSRDGRGKIEGIKGNRRRRGRRRNTERKGPFSVLQIPPFFSALFPSFFNGKRTRRASIY